MAQENGVTSLERKKKKRIQIKRKHINSRENKINQIVKILFIILLIFIIIRGVISCVSLKYQESASEDKYNKMLEEKVKLEKQVEYINTPEYIEQAARETLKMVMPGEMLFVFKDKAEDVEKSEDGN